MSRYRPGRRDRRLPAGPAGVELPGAVKVAGPVELAAGATILGPLVVDGPAGPLDLVALVVSLEDRIRALETRP